MDFNAAALGIGNNARSAAMGAPIEALAEGMEVILKQSLNVSNGFDAVKPGMAFNHG